MTQPVSTRIHVQPDPMQAYMYSLCHALDVQISLSPTVSVRVTAAAAATIAAPVTLRSEKRVRMCVNTLRRTKSWKRMLTQSGTQQRCARPRGVCRPKQQCNKPSATVPLYFGCISRMPRKDSRLLDIWIVALPAGVLYSIYVVTKRPAAVFGRMADLLAGHAVGKHCGLKTLPCA
jgi:hypothetical protein